MKLTERQRQVLDHLRQQIEQTGLPPTLHELMAAFGWSSPTGAAKHLQALAAKGLIELSPNKARGIRLLESALPPGSRLQAGVPIQPASAIRPEAAHGLSMQAAGAGDESDDGSAPASSMHALAANADVLRLPLVGRVAAGLPILAGGHVERHLLVDRWVFQPRPDFLLRVQGDSMIEDNILDGDLIAGRSTPEASHGQIVIARIEGGITIKRLWHRDGQLRLLPRNARHSPIDPDPIEDFAIEGIYCGLLRQP